MGYQLVAGFGFRVSLVLRAPLYNDKDRLIAFFGNSFKIKLKI